MLLNLQCNIAQVVYHFKIWNKFVCLNNHFKDFSTMKKFLSLLNEKTAVLHIHDEKISASSEEIFRKFPKIKFILSHCGYQRPERLSVDQEEATIKILNLLETIFQYVPKPRAK